MRIALIADSHGWRTNPLVAAQLEDQGHQIVHAVYKNGWGIEQYLEDRLQLSHLLAADPELVIVALGGNNHNRDPSYGDAVQEFLEELQFPSRRVIWIGPAAARAPRTSLRHEWTADFLSGFLPNKGIAFLDSRPHTQGGHKGDGVHFTNSGYAAWSAGISSPLAAALIPASPLPFESLPYFVIGTSVLFLLGALAYRNWKK